MKLAVAFALALLASPALAAPQSDPRDAQIAELKKEVADANQKGAYWMGVAIALQKQRNAALDADVPLIAFPTPPQQQGPHP